MVIVVAPRFFGCHRGESYDDGRHSTETVHKRTRVDEAVHVSFHASQLRSRAAG
jgi:hypothetical protein